MKRPCVCWCPHPLIGHWLTLLRDAETPQPLFATAMAELGRWLTYEPCGTGSLSAGPGDHTLAQTEGTIVDGSIPLLAVPILRAGLGLWDGAKTVIPSASVAHGFATGWGQWPLPLLLQQLQIHPGQCGCAGLRSDGRQRRHSAQCPGAARNQRGQWATGPCGFALTASPGLKTLGERYSDLTIYTGCIDAELDEQLRIVQGLGDAGDRLYGKPQSGFVG